MNVSNNSHLKIRGASWKKYGSARLQISVGQPYHEGADFAEAAAWAASNFEKTIICVNDTLQRYNGPGAREAGNAWLERNKKTIDELPNVEVIRWDYWLNHPDFPSLYAELKNKYKTDPSFREAVDYEAAAFAVRQKPISMGAFLERSRAYLLEECSAFQIMFRTPAADIYPGSSLLPCQIFKGDEGKGFTRVELKRSVFNRKIAAQVPANLLNPNDYDISNLKSI